MTTNNDFFETLRMFPGRGRPPHKPLLPPRPGQSWRIQRPQGGSVENQEELEDLKDFELSTQWSQTDEDEYGGIDLSETYWTQEKQTGAGQDESPGHPLFFNTPHNSKMMTKPEISWQEPNQEFKGRPNPFTTPQYPTKQCNPQGRGAPTSSFRFLHPGLGGSFALEEKTRETIVLKTNIGTLQKLLQNMTKKNYFWWIHDKPNQTEQSQGFQQCPVNMAPPLQTVPPNHQWSQKQPQKQIQPNQIEPEEENHTIKTMLKMMEDNLNIMKNMWNQMSMSN